MPRIRKGGKHFGRYIYEHWFDHEYGNENRRNKFCIKHDKQQKQGYLNELYDIVYMDILCDENCFN